LHNLRNKKINRLIDFFFEKHTGDIDGAARLLTIGDSSEIILQYFPHSVFSTRSIFKLPAGKFVRTLGWITGGILTYNIIVATVLIKANP